MSTGEPSRWQHWFFAILVLGFVFLCTALLVLANPNKLWTVVLQVATAAFGAMLGNLLRLDWEQAAVRSQARVSVRHLLDHLEALSVLVTQVQQRITRVAEMKSNQIPLDWDRVSDWLSGFEEDVRRQITTASSATKNWGDLASDVLSTEVENYRLRDQRLSRENGAS